MVALGNIGNDKAMAPWMDWKPLDVATDPLLSLGVKNNLTLGTDYRAEAQASEGLVSHSRIIGGNPRSHQPSGFIRGPRSTRSSQDSRPAHSNRCITDSSMPCRRPLRDVCYTKTSKLSLWWKTLRFRITSCRAVLPLPCFDGPTRGGLVDHHAGVLGRRPQAHRGPFSASKARCVGPITAIRSLGFGGPGYPWFLFTTNLRWGGDFETFHAVVRHRCEDFLRNRLRTRAHDWVVFHFSPLRFTLSRTDFAIRGSCGLCQDVFQSATPHVV